MVNAICERRGTEYPPESVDVLFDMLSRNLASDTVGSFHLYTDQPDQFGPHIIVHGLSEPRVRGLNLTLDDLIVGSLDEIAAEGGIANDHVTYFTGGPFPDGSKIVRCIGKKPWEFDGWVKHIWKIGGGTASAYTFTSGISSEERRGYVASALAQEGIRWFEPVAAHERHAILCGGAPSLAKDLDLISAGLGDIFAFNNVPGFLAEHGITPDYHVMLDAHEATIAYVHPELRMARYYASQCRPEVLDLAGDELICWHAASDCLDGFDLKSPVVGGGISAPMRGLVLAYGLGYRKFHLFGLDSSFSGGKQFAYEQLMKYPEEIEVTCGDQTFKSSPQLVGQAEDFKRTAIDLVHAGCEITVYGGGLLKAIADKMTETTGE
jgi:hypothetical protein